MTLLLAVVKKGECKYFLVNKRKSTVKKKKLSDLPRKNWLFGFRLHLRKYYLLMSFGKPHEKQALRLLTRDVRRRFVTQ